MIRFFTFIAMGLLALPAMAQDLSEPEAQVLPRLLDMARADLFPEAFGDETVVLLRDDAESAADLVIMDGEGSPLLVARAVVFAGPMAGQSPSLDPLPNGSLALDSEQTGIGRSPWNQRLTLAHRDGALRVVGLSYSSYDRLTAASASCDVNLRTGAWEGTWSNGTDPDRAESGRTDAAAPPLGEWVMDDLPAPCRTMLEKAGL